VVWVYFLASERTDAGSVAHTNGPLSSGIVPWT
jgi:hypothetical protein